jgi:cobalt-zinc-cadmium efflux system outer membrane protein
MKFWRLLIITLFLSGCPLFGQNATNLSGPQVTLSDVLRLIGGENPRVAATRETVAVARAERRIAGAYPNPKIAASHLQPAKGERTIFTGDRQEQVTMEFPLLIPGQRSSRIAKADAEIAAAEARVANETNLLASEAIISFMHLLALQETGSVLSNDFAEVTHARDIVAGRREQGAASDYDVTRVEVELGVLGSGLEGARAEIAAEAGQLAAHLGLTNGLPSAEGALQPWELSSDTLTDYGNNPLDTPMVLAAARDAAAAEKGITVAKRDRWPELSIAGGRTWTENPFGAADYVGLNLEIPIFDRRGGQLEKAKSEARAAEARYRIAVAEASAALRQLVQAVERRQAALDRYRTDIQPRLERLKQMSADAYSVGRHSLLELLDAQKARREISLDRIQTVAALVEAQIRLLSATGRLIPYLASPDSLHPKSPPNDSRL